jgi:HAD superfamily hydrolase (TIGR01490 family)
MCRFMTKAAFYDLDGTLLSTNLVYTHAYYARNERSLRVGAYRFAKVLANVPIYFGLNLYSRSAFNRRHFLSYQGMHRDRMIGLSDDLFETVLKPSIFPEAQALIDTTRALGYRNVLVTGELDLLVRPIGLHFGMDDVICNQLEFENHTATGRVLEPLLAEDEKAKAIQEYCANEGIDPDDCCAFADSSADLPMLEAVGRPVATNPAITLHRVAIDRGWPILELSETPLNFPPFLRIAKAV